MKKNLKDLIETWQMSKFLSERRKVFVEDSLLAPGEYVVTMELKDNFNVLNKPFSLKDSRVFHTFIQSEDGSPVTSDGDTVRFQLSSEKFVEDFMIYREQKIREEIDKLLNNP